MYPTLTPECLLSAGWQVTAEHAASSYGMPVLVSPNGDAIGDGDVVCLGGDGSLCGDLFEGRLVAGRTIREMVEAAMRL